MKQFTQFMQLVQQWVPAKKPHIGRGLDISNRALIFISLQKKGNVILLDQLAIQPIPQEILQEDRVKDAPALSAKLKKMVERLTLVGKEVSIAIPVNLVATTTIELAGALSEKEQDVLVKAELRKSFSQGFRDLLYDYMLEKKANTPSPGKLQIIAVHRADVEGQLEALKLSKLKPCVLYLDCYAIHAAYRLIVPQVQHITATDEVVMIHIEDKTVLILVVVGGKLVNFERKSFQHEVLESFVVKIFSFYQEKEVAEHKKAFHAFLDQTSISSSELNEQLAALIKETFDASLEGGASVRQIVLSGPGALIPGLPTYLNEVFQISAMTANPFSQLKMKEDSDTEWLLNFAPMFMLACGLALRSIEK